MSRVFTTKTALQALVFIILFLGLTNIIYTQENNTIIFSQDEVEIINRLFEYYVNNIENAKILILKTKIEWYSYLQNIRINNIRNEINNDELINNFIINNNSNGNSIIGEENIFIVENVQFLFEDNFNEQYESQILIENKMISEIVSLFNVGIDEVMEKVEEYERIRLRRTYITISRIGFNEAKNRAFLSFEYNQDHMIPRTGIGYLLLTKENGKWVIDRRF